MQDWEGKHLGEAMALRHKMPSFIPLQNQFQNWGTKVSVLTCEFLRLWGAVRAKINVFTVDRVNISGGPI